MEMHEIAAELKALATDTRTGYTLVVAGRLVSVAIEQGAFSESQYFQLRLLFDPSIEKVRFGVAFRCAVKWLTDHGIGDFRADYPNSGCCSPPLEWMAGNLESMASLIESPPSAAKPEQGEGNSGKITVKEANKTTAVTEVGRRIGGEDVAGSKRIGFGSDPQTARKIKGKTKLATAMMLVQEHPDWSDRYIAEQAGYKRHSTLVRNKTYQTAAAMARGQKEDLPHGTKDGETRNVEAWEDANEQDENEED